MAIPRMRTIPDAIRDIRHQDPNSAINESWLRSQIRAGDIPYVKAGKRYLINMDILEQYLSNIQPSLSNKDVGTKIQAIDT